MEMLIGGKSLAIWQSDCQKVCQNLGFVRNILEVIFKNHNRVVKGGPFTYWFDKYPAYCHYLVSIITYVFKVDVGWLDQKK